MLDTEVNNDPRSQYTGGQCPCPKGAVTYLAKTKTKTQNIKQKPYCNKFNEDLTTTTATNGGPKRKERRQGIRGVILLMDVGTLGREQSLREDNLDILI